MTKKQQETYAFVGAFNRMYGRQPTYQEIQKHFDLKSTSSAWERVDKMKKSAADCPLCHRPL